MIEEETLNSLPPEDKVIIGAIKTLMEVKPAVIIYRHVKVAPGDDGRHKIFLDQYEADDRALTFGDFALKALFSYFQQGGKPPTLAPPPTGDKAPVSADTPEQATIEETTKALQWVMEQTKGADGKSAFGDWIVMKVGENNATGIAQEVALMLGITKRSVMKMSMDDVGNRLGAIASDTSKVPELMKIYHHMYNAAQEHSGGNGDVKTVGSDNGNKGSSQ